MKLSRRDWLAAGALSAASLGSASAAGESFRLVHVTDFHLQPEMKAAEGSRQCIAAINKVKPELVLTGGDLIFDALARPRERAKLLFDLYKDTVKRLEAPLHNVLGNHDIFGVLPESGVSPAELDYGKKMYEDRIGPRYYSFDFKGWHFMMLDSVGITPQRGYIGAVDEEQLAWMRQDLAKVGKVRPVIAVCHIPLSTGHGPWLASADGVVPPTLVVAKAKPVLELLHEYNIKAVLQGHTHIPEVLEYRGCQYITSGSVCGEWWKGPRLGVHPEGFGIIEIEGDQVRWRYQAYGFQAEFIEPKPRKLA